LLLFAALGVATLSIERANWIQPQPSLVSVLALSLVGGLLILKLDLSNRLTVLLMVVAGLVVTAWHSAALVGFGEEMAVVTWWRAITTIRPNEGTLHFAMFLIAVMWVIGVVSTWFVLRRRNAWVTAGLGALAVVVNLSNLPRDEYYFLPLYLIAALLLLGQVHVAGRGSWTGRQGAVSPRRGIIYVVSAVLAASLLSVGAAWLIPEPPVDRLGLVSVDGTGSTGQWFNIFADVRSKWNLIDSKEQGTLRFTDPLSTSNRLQFIVTADQPSYWRVRRYDTYQSWGWTSSEVIDREPEEVLAAGTGTAEGEEFTYTVENKLRTDVLLALGELVSADISFKLQTLAPEESDPEAPDPEALTDSPPPEDMGEVRGDAIAAVALRMMKPYHRYEAVGSVVQAAPEALAEAGDDYPEDIAGRYLQLPPTLPERVRRLAETVTVEAETPYDKTVAVVEHVLGLRYNVNAAVPPEDADGVDHFLFVTGEGVCTEFASAVAVMLRTIGVPARINAGYLEGEPGAEEGTYDIRVKDYHARTEVYFPGYGWVEFPATPVSGSYEALASSGVEAVDNFIVDPSLEQLDEAMIFGPEAGLGGGGSARNTGIPGPSISVYFAVIGIPVAIILAIRLAMALVLQRLKRAGSTAEVWRRMVQLASLARYGPLAGETPLEYGARLETIFPERTWAIETIAQSYVETQYSQRKELARLQHHRLQKSWVEFCPPLFRQALRFWSRPE
jgi:transglutaminase-like putative cysteine protease